MRLSSLIWMMNWLFPFFPYIPKSSTQNFMELAPSSLALVWLEFLTTV